MRPKAAQGLRAKRARCTRVLCTRVDYLCLKFQGALAEHVRRELEARLGDAAAAGTDVALTLNGVLLTLQKHGSRAGHWVLRHAWARILVGDSDPNIASGDCGWNVTVTAEGLAERADPYAALTLAREIAGELLHVVLDERVHRLDQAADVVGFDLERVNFRSWLLPRRAAEPELIRERGHRESFNFGLRGSPIYCRVYDKTRELGRPEQAEKRELEESRWRHAGWEGERVARVEFELRSDALKEFGLRDDPERALESLNAMWGYCTRKWLTLRRRRAGCKTRDDRLPVDARWKVVQGAKFSGHDDGEIATRTRTRGAGTYLRAASALLGAVVAAGDMEPAVPGVRAKKHLEPSSDTKCEGLVHHEMARAARSASRRMAEALIAVKGARGAAEWIIEKENAATTRRRVHVVADQQHAVEKVA